MRVISKIKDYYDFSCYSPTDTIVYERNLNDYFIDHSSKDIFKRGILQYNEDLINELNKVFSRNSILHEKSIIIIGQKIIKFLTIEVDHLNFIFIFHAEELENLELSECQKKDFISYLEKTDTKQLYTDIRNVTDKPIVTRSIYSESLEDKPINQKILPGANFDTTLKAFKLQDYIPGNLVAQELSLYINSLKEKDIKDMSNDIKIVSHGFDRKSFRRN
jgi:hypothetical protein